MMHSDTRAIQGGTLKPLTVKQKTILVLLARRAWEARGCPDGSFEFWRQEQSQKACGRRISQAVQQDYLPLRAHFLNLVGESGEALELLLRADGDERRQAMYKLERTCRERGVALGYADAICRKQYRCTLADAQAEQLWRLIFTVRNRRRPAI